MKIPSTVRLISKTIVITAVFTIGLFEPSSGQNKTLVKAQEITRAAMDAYRRHDYRSALNSFLEARVLRPDHPTLRYNIAATSSLTGDKRNALQELTTLSSMGLIYHPERDSDFVAVWGDREFLEIISRFDRNAKPTGRSELAFRLAEKGLIAEGIALNPNSGALYVSSVRKRKIVQVDRNGRETDFSASTDGLFAAMGMKVDRDRGVLWVCSSAVPQMNGSTGDVNGRAGLFKYDLANGRLVRKYLSDTLRPHIFGDLVLSKSGEPYVTDSRSPAIYRIRSRSDQLELFLESDSFASLQGIAFSDDERTLYVADYSRGVFTVDMSSQKVSILDPPENCTLLGIDGLYQHGRSLVAIQNGVNPNRVLRVQLDKEGKKIDSWVTLESNHVDFDEPTLGFVEGNNFFYVANSQWSKVDRKGGLPPDSTLAHHVILKIAL
ncbi:MAG: hypothetical protein WEB62_03785 [Bacteroidota bacterium]